MAADMAALSSLSNRFLAPDDSSGWEGGGGRGRVCVYDVNYTWYMCSVYVLCVSMRWTRLWGVSVWCDAGGWTGCSGSVYGAAEHIGVLHMLQAGIPSRQARAMLQHLA